MPFQIVRADITKFKADVIVNSANPQPVIGSGVDSAIYQAAGAEKMIKARQKIGPIATGEVAVTKGFSLPAKYVIHTVGPVWSGGQSGEFLSLASCYRKSLEKAEELHCKSIVFPLISSGVYGFPKDQALNVALREIHGFIEHSEIEVILAVFDRTAFELSGERVREVLQYIEDAAVRETEEEEYGGFAPPYGHFPDHVYMRRPSASMPSAPPASPEKKTAAKEKAVSHMNAAPTIAPKESLESDRLEEATFDSAYFDTADLTDILRLRDESFQQRLFRMIDERGMTDTEVYKKANLDRKLFSKIRCNENYKPKKQTALAFAIALGLNLDETTDLLKTAGYALSGSTDADLIVRYCIENKMYDIFDVNALLFKFDQQLLGS